MTLPAVWLSGHTRGDESGAAGWRVTQAASLVIVAYVERSALADLRSRQSGKFGLSFLHGASASGGRDIMKIIHWTIAAAAFAFVQPAPASAAQVDPEVVIYRFPGVLDSGSPETGVATVFHCTNFSGVTENIRFVTRDDVGTLLTNNSLAINHLQTRTVATHGTTAYTGAVFGTGSVNSGTTAIAATSINIICTAMTI